MPLSITEVPAGRSGRKESPTSVLRRHTRGLGEVLAPEDSEPPILAPAARAALLEWMVELDMADALKAAGIKPRATCLLHGPPGCGKTTLVHHFAGRLGIPMLLVGSENLFGSYLGESEKNMTRLFDTVEQADVRCVIFLDEVDAVGGRRNREALGADNARNSMLGVLLRRIERFEGGFLVGATNLPDRLDPALWRRFALQLAVDLPGEDERFAIMRRYGAPFGFSDDDLDRLCALTDGASPALLRGVMEGLKRALILGPRLKWDVADVVQVMTRVVAAVRPPPEFDPPPPLWQGRDEIRRGLAGMTWPPGREDGQ
jgi:SpoVK/Ycf46/Vps4 family AAA+-type ATPase